MEKKWLALIIIGAAAVAVYLLIPKSLSVSQLNDNIEDYYNNSVPVTLYLQYASDLSGSFFDSASREDVSLSVFADYNGDEFNVDTITCFNSTSFKTEDWRSITGFVQVATKRVTSLQDIMLVYYLKC